MAARAKGIRNPRSGLSIPEQHQLEIAKRTLRIPDAMVEVMGGPTKAEAREIIKRLTGKPPTENPGEAWHKDKAEGDVPLDTRKAYPASIQLGAEQLWISGR